MRERGRGFQSKGVWNIRLPPLWAAAESMMTNRHDAAFYENIQECSDLERQLLMKGSLGGLLAGAVVLGLWIYGLIGLWFHITQPAFTSDQHQQSGKTGGMGMDTRFGHSIITFAANAGTALLVNSLPDLTISA